MFSRTTSAVMIFVVLAGYILWSIPLSYKMVPVSASIKTPVSSTISGPWGQPAMEFVVIAAARTDGLLRSETQSTRAAAIFFLLFLIFISSYFCLV